MKVLLILFGLFLLLSCGTRKLHYIYPRMVFHQTDSGTCWVYKNHERGEVIGPIFIMHISEPGDSTEIDYFPNGF